jgi:hypothetical protein
MATRWGPRIASLVVVILVAVVAYRWWASDERAIRRQLSAIAESLTVAPNEGSLGSISRLAQLRKALAPDIRVSPVPRRSGGGDQADDIVGRDAVLALASRWAPPAGGVTVEFVDVRVTVGDSGTDAQVSCAAKVTSGGASEEPTVDVRDVMLAFRKIDGAWLVSAARPVEAAPK